VSHIPEHQPRRRQRSATTPPVAARTGAGDDAELRAAVLVQASLGCFDVAITRWSVTDEPAPTLLRRTFDTLRDAV